MVAELQSDTNRLENSPLTLGRARQWMYSVTIALVPVMVSGALWLAYHQGTQDDSLARIEHDLARASVTETADVAAANTRARRVRDDLTLYQKITTDDLTVIKSGIAAIQQQLRDMEKSAPRHAEDKPETPGPPLRAQASAANGGKGGEGVLR